MVASYLELGRCHLYSASPQSIQLLGEVLDFLLIFGRRDEPFLKQSAEFLLASQVRFTANVESLGGQVMGFVQQRPQLLSELLNRLVRSLPCFSSLSSPIADGSIRVE